MLFGMVLDVILIMCGTGTGIERAGMVGEEIDDDNESGT